MEYDLMNVPAEVDKRTYKLKRMVPAPNSYFLKIRCKCTEDVKITFSNSQTTLICNNCNTVMARPTGGKLKITEGCQFSVFGVKDMAN